MRDQFAERYHGSLPFHTGAVVSAPMLIPTTPTSSTAPTIATQLRPNHLTLCPSSVWTDDGFGGPDLGIGQVATA